jgi:photosystem II stability/assembly factor-like uncharacterized protein
MSIPRASALRVFVCLVLFVTGALPAQSGIDRTESQQPTSPLVASHAQYLEARATTPFGLQWVSIGPVLNSARVESVQGHPARPGTLYVAFGAGNLWKTTNGGLAWKPIFDDQTALGIGDIALAPSDPDVIWVGSGVSLKKPRNFTMPGTGVFVSRDGGESFHNVGLEDSWHIGEIAVHPTDPNTVLVAVLGHFWSTNPNRGLYRTADGGRSWQHVLFVDEKTGANDVVFAPSDPAIVYASTWCNHPGVGGPTSGVHKSTDGGRTWTRLGGGLPDGSATGRIGLCVSWQDPDKAYAFVDNLNRGADAEDNPAELYRTDDGGARWVRTHEQDLEIASRIGWYFADCYVDPQNDDEVYLLSVRIAHSKDGGKSFDLVDGDVTHLVPSPAQSLHLDHCELWIDPSNPDHLVLGNDGGLYTSMDRGRSWLHHNVFPTGEFYDVAVDDFPRADGAPYTVFGGTQDDSSVKGPPLELRAGVPDRWEYVWLDPWCGGDGCYTVPDPKDQGTVYFSAQHGALRRQDVATNTSKPIPPRLPRGFGAELAHNFIAPYLVSAHDHRVLYHGGNFVLRSPDRGDSWHVISKDLTQSSIASHGGIAAGALAESPLRRGLLYCGTDQGAFWMTPDDGATWVERSRGLPPHYVRSICASRHDEARVYTALAGINTDDLHAYLFASNDRGETWRPIMAGLPNEVVYAITEDPRHADVIYCAAYRGVYVSTDRGANWALLGFGLPAVAVADLVVQDRTLDLIAATHGRGMYRTNLAPLHSVLASGGSAGNALFALPTAYAPHRDDTIPRPRRTFEERVPISFHLERPADLTMRVRDAQGGTVVEKALAGRRGLNQFLWDLVVARRTSPKPYFLGQVEFLAAGEYSISIVGEGVDLSGPPTVAAR